MFEYTANTAIEAALINNERAKQNAVENMRHSEAMSLERQKVNAETESARELQKQTLQQSDMIRATFQMVEKQQSANELQEKSNEILNQQLDFLQKQNEDQAKELKRSRIFQLVSWGITTAVAISSILVQIIK